jgi:hypothetical protein
LANEITCTVGGELIVLRPTLRRALRLARREGSFAKLIEDIQDGSLAAALAIVADNYSGADLEAKLLSDGLIAIDDPLLVYVLECAGLSDEMDAKSKSSGKSVSFEEHLTGLFRIATGWIGWTPQQSWDATPAEIIEAYKGRVEMLKAIFGASDKDDAESIDTNERFKTVLGAIGTVKMERTQ